MKKKIQTPHYQNLYNDYNNFILVKEYKGRMYQSNVKRFLIWMETHGITSIKEVTTKAMMDYYQYLISEPSPKGKILADATVKLYLLSISFFVENLLLKGELIKAFLIPKHGNGEQTPRGYLTVEEITMLYKHTKSPLERALLAVGYGCGLRRSEIENLNTSDIQLPNSMLIVRSGKGGKRREVPMSNTVVKDVKQYITEYRYKRLVGMKPETAFFVSSKGNRTTGGTLNRVLKKIIVRTDNDVLMNKEISLHSLRHSIAHHLIENNASVDFIKDFLGHSKVNTTYIYAIKNKQKTTRLKSHHLLKQTANE
mgnify:CR=1 FL=1